MNVLEIKHDLLQLLVETNDEKLLEKVRLYFKSLTDKPVSQNALEPEKNTDFDYEKYITEGAPLSEKELLKLIDEAEKSENLTPEEFRQALGI